jgi:hypothetical protein
MPERLRSALRGLPALIIGTGIAGVNFSFGVSQRNVTGERKLRMEVSFGILKTHPRAYIFKISRPPLGKENYRSARKSSSYCSDGTWRRAHLL